MKSTAAAAVRSRSFVRYVIEEAPAARAGIAVGDTIAAVNRLPVDNAAHDELMSRLNEIAILYGVETHRFVVCPA